MTTITTFDQFKLETIFNSDDTVSHVNDKDGLVSRTTWKQDTELGSGNFGEVWREKEIGGEVRAVKIIMKRILTRELEVLVRVNDVRFLPRACYTLPEVTDITISVSGVIRRFPRLV